MISVSNSTKSGFLFSHFHLYMYARYALYCKICERDRLIVLE